MDLFNENFYQDFFKYYPSYLSKGDVLFFKKSNCFVAFKFNIVKDILQNPSVFSSEYYSLVDKILLGADGKVHSNSKKTVLKNLDFLKQQFSDKETIFCSNLIDKLISEVTKNGSEKTNLIYSVIDPFVYNFTMEQFGLLENYQNLNLLSTEGDFDEKLKIIQSIFENGLAIDRVNEESIKSKKISESFKSLFKEFSASEIFTEDDILNFMNLFTRASVLTSASLLSSCVFYFDKLDSQYLENDEYLESFIKEVLRIHSPSQFTFRHALEKIIIDNVSIPKGALVALSLGAANRDDSVFKTANEFVIDRTEKHIAFGFSKHKCIGEIQAVQLTKIFIRCFYPHFTNFVFDGKVTFDNSIHILRISKLNVCIK
jgi:cytochrome P450